MRSSDILVCNGAFMVNTATQFYGGHRMAKLDDSRVCWRRHLLLFSLLLLLTLFVVDVVVAVVVVAVAVLLMLMLLL